MNELDLENFERELRAVRPAPPPEDFLARLTAAHFSNARAAPAQRATPRGSAGAAKAGFSVHWFALLQWFTPVAALAILLALLWPKAPPGPRPDRIPPSTASPASLKADSVRLNEKLLGTFDAVGHLPDGEPVRFRYQQWMDQLVVYDKANGLVIEKRTPRVEVIPVRFETY